jgi:hypothetical protein
MVEGFPDMTPYEMSFYDWMVEGFHYMTPYEMSFYDWMVEGFPDMIQRSFMYSLYSVMFLVSVRKLLFIFPVYLAIHYNNISYGVISGFNHPIIKWYDRGLKRSSKCLSFASTGVHAWCFVVLVAHLIKFLCCQPIMCLYVISSVLWCPLHMCLLIYTVKVLAVIEERKKMFHFQQPRNFEKYDIFLHIFPLGMCRYLDFWSAQ